MASSVDNAKERERMSSLAGGGRLGLLLSVAAWSLSHHKTAVKVCL